MSDSSVEIYQKIKNSTLTSYARVFLGFSSNDSKVQSLHFEEGINELAKSLNATKYVCTTSSCGGHIKGDPNSGSPYSSNAPYVFGTVWIGYATCFIEEVVNILRNNLLSTVELVIGTPARKRSYLTFCIKGCSIPEDMGILLRRRKEFGKIAKAIAEIASDNSDPIWFSLLRTNK